MKKINQYRFKNTYSLVSLILLLSLLIISWFYFSSLFEILTMDYNAPDLVGMGDPREIRSRFIEGILRWEVWVDASMRCLIYLFPIFAILPVLPFQDEKKLYFRQGYHRFKNYHREVIKTILQYSLIGGGVLSLGFVIYYSIGSFFLVPSIENIGGYASIFPADFYWNYPYLFFLFMAVTIYFAIGFTFALMACGISLLVDNKYLMVVLPWGIYLMDAYLLGGLGLHEYQIFASVCSFNTLLTTFESFIPVLILLILAIFMTAVGIFKKRRLMEW